MSTPELDDPVPAPVPPKEVWQQRAGPVFYWGIATAFALIIGGALASYLTLVTQVLSNLLFVSGISLILGAFGSTEVVNLTGKGVTLTGVAATVLMLNYLVSIQGQNRHVLV